VATRNIGMIFLRVRTLGVLGVLGVLGLIGLMLGVEEGVKSEGGSGLDLTDV
jgi:hypothetical protein